MRKGINYLALDLGAESGRGIIGSLEDGKLRLDVVHRFPNAPVKVRGSLFWNALGLFEQIEQAIARAGRRYELSGIGIDTWGVDFGLLGSDDTLLGNPFHYRDQRTEGVMERVFEIVSAEEIFERTGIQFMRINSLYQLYSMKLLGSPLLEIASSMMLIPNLLTFWLSGVKCAEFTNATTTQCYDPRAGDWAWQIIDKLGLPKSLFPEVIQPGTILGPMLPEAAEYTGAGRVPIIATASHDTASAVAAVPSSDSNSAYISSGTWSLMGVETSEPIINDFSRECNFTNEGGVCGSYRFLKNIMGLWLVQEMKRTWAKEGSDISYSQLSEMAASAQPFKCIIDPDDPSFLAPGDMPARIRNFCESSGQATPKSRGEFVRTALEGLALRYRSVLEKLETLTSRHIKTIHIVGGGSQNRLLCQFAADATAREVVAGPIEATAAGNILVQAMACGEISSLEEAREIIRSSFKLTHYQPKETEKWDEAYQRFTELTSPK